MSSWLRAQTALSPQTGTQPAPRQHTCRHSGHSTARFSIPASSVSAVRGHSGWEVKLRGFVTALGFDKELLSESSSFRKPQRSPDGEDVWCGSETLLALPLFYQIILDLFPWGAVPMGPEQGPAILRLDAASGRGDLGRNLSRVTLGSSARCSSSPETSAGRGHTPVSRETASACLRIWAGGDKMWFPNSVWGCCLAPSLGAARTLCWGSSWTRGEELGAVARAARRGHRRGTQVSPCPSELCCCLQAVP